MEKKKEIGVKLMQLRLERNSSQSDIADLLNISQQAYSNYENGKSSPSFEMLMEISRIYAISIDELVGNDGFIKNIEGANEIYHDGVSIGNLIYKLLLLKEKDRDFLLTILEFLMTKKK